MLISGFWLVYGYKKKVLERQRKEKKIRINLLKTRRTQRT